MLHDSQAIVDMRCCTYVLVIYLLEFQYFACLFLCLFICEIYFFDDFSLILFGFFVPIL
jgi:hypothetical protein